MHPPIDDTAIYASIYFQAFTRLPEMISSIPGKPATESLKYGCEAYVIHFEMCAVFKLLIEQKI